MIKALAALEPKSALVEFEFERPELGEDDVEIEVSHCGLCHSDMSMINNEWGASSYPLVPGHEVVGKVVAIGANVNKHAIGDRVGLGWHAGYCDTCQYCDTGEHNLCAQSQATIIGRHGGFASHVQASQNAVVALPEGLSSEDAGPLFCGGITVYNPLVQYDIKPTDRVAVIGIGGLGHIALQFLAAWGCEVTAFTSSESKAEEAKALGATHVLDSTNPDALKAARGRFDMILCTVNVSLNWAGYLSTLAPKGRLHFVGVVVDPVAISVNQLIGNQLQISGSPVGSPAVIDKMLQFAARHNIKPQVEVFKKHQANEAIEKLESGKMRYRAVIEFSE